MNNEEVQAVLAPLQPRSGDSIEGFISASDLQESLVILMGLVERDIQRALASASAYGAYVRVCDTEIQWDALQQEAAGETIPDGCLAIVKASADPGTTNDAVYAWDGEQWLLMMGG